MDEHARPTIETVQDEYEFTNAHNGSWAPTAQNVVTERVLSRDRDDPDILTRLARWAPGLDTQAGGVVTTTMSRRCTCWRANSTTTRSMPAT